MDVDNAEEVAELLRQFFHESSFTHLSHNRSDSDVVDITEHTTLDMDAPGVGVELHPKQPIGEVWGAAITLRFKLQEPTSHMSGIIFGISSGNPVPDVFSGEVDRNPLLTLMDDVLVIQSENILREVSTDIFYRLRRSNFITGEG